MSPNCELFVKRSVYLKYSEGGSKVENIEKRIFFVFNVHDYFVAVFWYGADRFGGIRYPSILQ